MPAKDVVIKVDGVETTTTDKQGIYYLTFDKIPGTYEIEVESPRHYIEPMTVRVDENLRQLPPIVARAVYLCGGVLLID